ncbi:MAG TPA: (deoxy)nucleoside triphosphate pyrophosphohydrolase [Candidatus Limnocylindrales bacterium]|jgi:8-oxo-dGTP diphosphatase|nr:(deoxy)nucleoside triphosphate pyrophosphohydrolase [Candidatus Limnocylindrales bacterium]
MKPDQKLRQVVAALIMRQGEILVCQRTKHQTMPLKWEFPGGKIEPGEKPEDALHRELEEELGIRAKIGRHVETIRHVYNGGSAFELHFFLVEEFAGEIQNRIFRDIQWAKKEALPRFDFLEADVELVRRLASGNVL